MPFVSGLQGPTFRPLHSSRPAPCLPCHQRRAAAGRAGVLAGAKKVAASELRGLSDDEILQQVAASQFELVQLEWKVSRKEVGPPWLPLGAEPLQQGPHQTLRTCADGHDQRLPVAQEARAHPSRPACSLAVRPSQHMSRAPHAQIARLLTVKREREIKQGVDKRESRRRERWAPHACWAVPLHAG